MFIRSRSNTEREKVGSCRNDAPYAAQFVLSPQPFVFGSLSSHNKQALHQVDQRYGPNIGGNLLGQTPDLHLQLQRLHKDVCARNERLRYIGANLSDRFGLFQCGSRHHAFGPLLTGRG
jgi:hypothetical protein